MEIAYRFLLNHIPEPYRFPGFIVLIGLLIWLTAKFFLWPRPSLSILLIYFMSIAIALNLHLPRIRVCTALVDRCAHPLIWQRFLSDVAFWFVFVYIVMKLISRINRNQLRKIEAQL